jgi:hypothetical protein
MFESAANPSFKTRKGLGLGHLAAGSRRVSVSLLETLASWGVPKQGRIILHYSAIEGNLTEDMLRFIYGEIGLSEGLHGEHGKTPLDYAVEMRTDRA